MATMEKKEQEQEHMFTHDYRITTHGKITVSVMLEKCHWIKCHPRSVVAYSAEDAHHAVPIRYSFRAHS